MEGFIYLHRKMLDWEWYDDINTCRVFLHCLFRANWKPCKWHGVDIEAGQFITSLQNLAIETGLSVRQIRTALDHLISTGEVTSKSHSKFRIITVNNWERYQVIDKQDDKQATKKRQASDKQATTDEERNKEIKNKENKYICAFDEFWKIYPRKQDKARAYKCYVARLNDGYTEDQLLTACKNYSKVCEDNKTEQRYIKHGATFLSVNEPFLDYLKGETDGLESKVREYERREEEYRAYIQSDEYREAAGSPFD